MDINKLKADIEALTRYDHEVSWDGCPCCEPSASSTMTIYSGGDWIKRDDVLDLFKE